MNFQRGRQKEEPEINLVPMIDVLLVILIFLMITTTYSKFSELEITLPQATSEQATAAANVIDITVSANGSYTVNRKPIELPSSAQTWRGIAQGGRRTVLIRSSSSMPTHTLHISP